MIVSNHRETLSPFRPGNMCKVGRLNSPAAPTECKPTAVESAAPQKRHRIGGFALVYNEAGHKLGVQKKLAEIA
jgi:hypothetical protein